MPGFAYGDSVKTGDDKYVLAQFRHDAILTWVSELRSFLDLRSLSGVIIETDENMSSRIVNSAKGFAMDWSRPSSQS